MCNHASINQRKTGFLPDCCTGLQEIIPAAFFKALCEPNRLLLVQALAGVQAPGRSLSELARYVDVDLSVLSRHCATLKSAGIVSATQMGRETRFVLERKQVADRLRLLADWIDKCP